MPDLPAPPYKNMAKTPAIEYPLSLSCVTNSLANTHGPRHRPPNTKNRRMRDKASQQAAVTYLGARVGYYTRKIIR